MREFLFAVILMFVANSVSFGQDLTASEIEEFKTLFIQIAVLMGMAIVVFLYVNLRANKTKLRAFKKLSGKSSVTEGDDHSLQQAVDLSPFAACIVNSENRPLFFNESFEKLTNHSIKFILRQTWFSLLGIEQEELNKLGVLNQGGTSRSLRAGEKRLLKVTRKAVSKSIGEGLQIMIFEDVTYSEGKINELMARKDYFRQVIDQSTSAIFIIDQEGCIIELNTRALDLTENGVLIGKDIFEFFPASFKQNFIEHQMKSRLTKIQFRSREYSFITETVSVPVELAISSIDYFDQEAYLVIVQDITERVEYERKLIEAQRKAEESDRLKASFLANMSHEVRTPMNSIMGFSELMCDDQLSDQERREFHGIVKTSSQQLLNLLDDIIEFSKIESGEIQLRQEPLGVDALMNDLKTYGARLLEKKEGIELVLESPIGFSVLPEISTDQTRVTQILKNLIDNAVKFTYAGQITIGYYYRPDNSIDFYVKDTGIGIPESKVSKIFHKFRQADEQNSRDFGGAGLGLSLSQQLARHLGGYLWVDTVEQKGSTFHLIMPCDIKSCNKAKYNNSTILYYCEEENYRTCERTIKDNACNVMFVFNEVELLNIPVSNAISGIVLNADIPESRLEKLSSIIKKEQVVVFKSRGVEGLSIKCVNNELALNHFIAECCSANR